MTGIVICLSAAAMGIDYGWQPVEGGIEYIIQIEPHLVESLQSGRDIFSDLPRSAQRIRSYRITVGTGRLPHHGEPPPDPVVVPAAGEEVGSAGNQPNEENEIDLSQLPGPILRPALTVGDQNHKGASEPRRLVGQSEPMANRVAGYHDSTTARPPNHTTDSQNVGPRQQPNTPFQAKKSHPIKTASQHQPAASEGEQPHQETESPSDTKPTVTAAATSRSVLQLGLFTSLACNAFLLWVTTGQRSRYRALVRRMFAGGEGSGYAAQLTAPGASETPRWEQIDEPGKPANPDAIDAS